MEQGGFGGGLGVVVLLVLAVARAVGADDLAVLVALDMDLAFAAGEGAGGELLDESFIMTAESLYLEAGSGRGAFVVGTGVSVGVRAGEVSGARCGVPGRGVGGGG